MALTGTQSRMARAALHWGLRDVAQKAKVSTNTLHRLEKGESLHERTLEAIQKCFEEAGITFIESEEISRGGGRGIRYEEEENITYKDILDNSITPSRHSRKIRSRSREERMKNYVEHQKESSR